MVNKVDELRATAFDLKPAIICLTETWSHNDISDAFLRFQVMKLFAGRTEKTPRMDAEADS